MSIQTKFGIVGLGFVGGAVRDSLDFGFCNLILVDPPKGLPHSYKDLADCEAVFVCVPSPSNEDGSCDTSILESTLEKLKDYNGVIISKTTAPPSVYENLSKQYKNLVHAPEFLTAANASRDYANGKFVSYNEYTTGTGFHLASTLEAMNFNNYHEALHMGFMMNIRKFI